MLNKIALVFPGQGSQKLGMLAEFTDNSRVRNTFLEASDVLGYDLWSLIQNGPEQKLNQTQYTQPAILAASLSAFWNWKASEQGSQAIKDLAYFAGHSLGEYSALVAAESLSFSAAVKLVSLRGRLMQEAVPEGRGAMAAILGLNDEQVRALCQKVSNETEKVWPVNYNCPQQVVIAGTKPAVEQAIEQAKIAGAKRGILLAMSVPSHCDLMRGAALKFKEALDQVKFDKPKVSILHNVDLCEHQDEKEIRDVLMQQLYQPVRWQETIQKMEDLGANIIYEVGPGNVLSGLNRRILPNIQCEVLPQEELVCP